MPFCKTNAFLVLTVLVIDSISLSDEGYTSKQLSGLIPALFEDQPASMPAMDSLFSTSVLAASPEDQDISPYCHALLKEFQVRYSAYVQCLVPSARPVTVCLSCFERYAELSDIYANISNDKIDDCRDSLLRSDRLMLIYLLYSNMQSIWESSNCDNCVDVKLRIVKNDTLTFMNEFNQSLSCFGNHSKANHSELCVKCKSQYDSLQNLYGAMEQNKSQICIDMEDSMNMTRRLWSKNYNCTASGEETIPVVAVSCFMLFLPIIFYLSSYLHSEQKKLKLIHPKRAKSHNSLVNIQDKFS